MTCADCGIDTGQKHARYCDAHRWQHRRKIGLYPLTAERRAYLQAHYSHTDKGCGARIATVLHVPTWRVRRWACELGLSVLAKKEPDWSAADIAFLETHIGSRHVLWIAKRLERSITAVVVKSKRLGISRRECRDWFTATQLAVGFGVDPTTVARWIEKGWLKARRFGQDHPDGRVCAHRISLAAARTFVREHPTAFLLAKVDQVWFLDLVCGRLGDDREVAS